MRSEREISDIPPSGSAGLKAAAAVRRKSSCFAAAQPPAPRAARRERRHGAQCRAVCPVLRAVVCEPRGGEEQCEAGWWSDGVEGEEGGGGAGIDPCVEISDHTSQ